MPTGARLLPTSGVSTTPAPPGPEAAAAAIHIVQTVTAVSTAIITVLWVFVYLQAVSTVCILQPHVSWQAYGLA